MALAFFLLIIASSISGLVSAFDYCRPDLCRPDRRPHVACPVKNSFGRDCGPDAREIPLDSRLKHKILDTHNRFRSDIALGKIHGFPAATRMGTLQWDAELATLARYHAIRCKFAHDKCRNTDQFRYAGQNIGLGEYYGMDLSPAQFVADSMKEWFDEKENCTVGIIQNYPMHYNGPMIGHFTQAVRDHAWKIGCYLVHYINQNLAHYLFTCNYSITNIMKMPVYESGKTGSKCTTGKNSKYTGLCSEREKYKAL